MDKNKEEFDQKITEQLNISRSTYTKERIKQHIARFEYAKTKAGIKDRGDSELLTRYDIIEKDGKKHLIKKGSEPYRYYSDTSELYDLIKKVHVMCNHGGEKRIMKILSQQYANITMNQIKIFKSVCDVCKAKKTNGYESETWNPNLKERFGSRGQVNIVDFQSMPHKGYSYILNYFDLETKFSLLRPLYSTQPAEIAIQLVDIFTTFGAPRMLHSDREGDFIAQVIHELQALWPELLIVQGKRNYDKNNDEENVLVESLLKSRMSDHPNIGWSDCLKFVQLEKNSGSNTPLTPFKAIFNQDPIIGLKQDIPPNILSENVIETEEDLKAIIAKHCIAEELSDIDSIDLPPANIPLDLKIENSYLDEMSDFLTETNAMTAQYACNVCNQTILDSPLTCIKCKKQVHHKCSQTSGQSDVISNTVCNQCIQDVVISSSGQKRKISSRNIELRPKTSKDEQEIISSIVSNEISSELPQLPEMLANFDTDTCTNQLFPNEAMRGIFEQVGNQFEVNCMPLFDS